MSKLFLRSLYLMLLTLCLPSMASAQTVAKIGATGYGTLAAAVSAAQAGETVEITVAGTYTLPSIPKNITIQGDVDGVVFNCVGAANTSIASIPNGATFKNVTFNFGNVNYHGFQQPGTINMEGCTLNGRLCSYGNMNFTNCKFVQNDGDYHMWVYGGTNAVVNYTGCTFTNETKGKFINVYSESNKNNVTVNISGCTFINKGTASKAAVNLKSTSGNNALAYTVNIDAASCSTEGAFPTAETSDASIYYNAFIQVDDVKAGVTDANSVTVDNVTIYEDGATVEVVEINTVDDLKTFRDKVNSGTSYDGKIVRLMADLDLSSETNWKPIGNLVSYPGQAFKGTFDGNGHIISNLTVNDNTPNHAVAALFGSIEKGSIVNLTVKDVNITSTHFAAGIVAYTSNTPSIINCHVVGGTITSTPELVGSSYDNGDKAGGIMGYCTTGTTIKDCTVEGVTITAYRDLAGICGYADGAVTDCTVKDVTVVQDNTNAYKDTDQASTACEVVGGRSANAATTNSGNGNTTENVIITHPVSGVAQIGTTTYATLQEAFDAAEAAGTKNIVIDLLADAELEINAWSGVNNKSAIGTAETESITINGNGHKLTFMTLNTDWNNVATMNDAVTKLTLNDMTIDQGGKNTNGTWNAYDINFNCAVELNNVTSNRPLAFKNDATLNNVTINDVNNKDVYGIWIQPNGQDVNIDGLTVTAKRGIKIDDQYVGAPEMTNLDIANATFNTTKKSAILVKTAGGATITAGEGINIENVAADNTNLVWIDEDKSAEFYNVTVTGANIIPEGGEVAYVVSLVRGEQVRGYYATFAEAYSSTDYEEGDSYELHKNTTETVEVSKALTIVKNGFTAANLTAAEGFQKTETDENITFVAFNPVAQIGDVKYETLEAAFAAATDGATITLLANCAGNGIKVPQGKFTTGLTVDFNGKTYTVDGATVGSTGTETQAFQLLKDNKITFQNGTIYSEKAKILVQNYSNLTLEGMTLTLNNTSYNGAYTLSNNNGNVVIDGTTINANPAGGFAFDVCRFSSYPSVNVEVKGSSVINGNVEISASGNDAKDGFGLKLTSGTLNGNIVVDASAAAAMKATPEKATVTKDDDFTQAAPEGYKWVADGEGTSKLVAIDYVAQIGTTKYETLEAAFAAAQDGETIALLADCAGNGIKVPQGKYTTGLTVNFGGFTYTVDGATVGSTGTETQAFQLLKDNKITFKNGTIYSEKALFLVQNYSDLTLEGMTLTLNNANYTSAYTLSNNNGNVVIDGTTINANPAGGFAFDVCRFSSYPSVSVTVTGESKINGDVEISASGSDPKNGLSLNLNGGTMTGDIVVDASAATIIETNPEKAVVTKADAFDKAAPAGYKWESNDDGTSTLVEATDIELANNGDNSAVITAANGKVRNVTLKGRTLYKDNYWNTICLPFDVTIDAESPLAGATVKELDAANSGYVAATNVLRINFKDAETDNDGNVVLKANTPYLLKWTSGNNIVAPVFNGVTVESGEAKAVSSDGELEFVGTASTVTLEGTKYAYFGNNNKLLYVDAPAGKKIYTCRAYFYLPNQDFKAALDETSGAKSFVLSFGDDDDDITRVAAVAGQQKAEDDVYYDLQGRKIVGQPTVSGIYVKNGVKVYVK